MICDSGANAEIGGEEVLEMSCSTSMRRKSGVFKNVVHKEKSVKKMKGKRKCAK